MAAGRNYYEILEIANDATDADIKRAYKRLVFKYHPDKNPEDPDATEKFKALSNAYITLSDPVKRSNYDHSLRYQDQAGEEPVQDEEPFSEDDIFNDFFQQFAGFKKNPQGFWGQSYRDGNKGPQKSYWDMDDAERAEVKKKLDAEEAVRREAATQARYQNYLYYLQETYAAANLPQTMQDKLEYIGQASLRFQKIYVPGFEFLYEHHNQVKEFLQAIVVAYKENPARRIVLEKAIDLIEDAFDNPCEATLQACKDHAALLPSMGSLKLKNVGVIMFGIAGIVTLLAGLASIVFGIIALSTGMGAPIGLAAIGAGVAGIGLAVGSFVGASKCAQAAANERQRHVTWTFNRLTDYIAEQEQKPTSLSM